MYAQQSTRTDSPTPLLQIVVAALSVITTKAVLASGYHYPLRLLLIHLSTSYILDGLRGDFERWFSNADRVGASPPHQRKESYNFIFVHLLQDLCTVGAMACEYEVLLHFEGLPTFAMLLCWNLLPPCWNRVPMVTSITTLMGLRTVLMFEQRLSLTGLGSIVASIALRKIAALLKHATAPVRRISRTEKGLDGYSVQLIQSNPYLEDPVSKPTISSQYPVISSGYYRYADFSKLIPLTIASGPRTHRSFWPGQNFPL